MALDVAESAGSCTEDESGLNLAREALGACMGPDENVIVSNERCVIVAKDPDSGHAWVIYRQPLFPDGDGDGVSRR